MKTKIALIVAVATSSIVIISIVFKRYSSADGPEIPYTEILNAKVLMFCDVKPITAKDGTIYWWPVLCNSPATEYSKVQVKPNPKLAGAAGTPAIGYFTPAAGQAIFHINDGQDAARSIGMPPKMYNQYARQGCVSLPTETGGVAWRCPEGKEAFKNMQKWDKEHVK